MPNNYFKKQRPKEKVTEMCKQFGYTKQAYYKQLTTEKIPMSKKR